MQANRRGSGHQRQSVNALIARSVASALQLNPFGVIWRPSTTSSGHLCSTGTLSPATGIYFCPVSQCGGQSGTKFNLHCHFLMQHPQDLVCIPIEGSQPLPQCKQCELQTPVEELNGGHHRKKLCQQGWERNRQHAAAVRSQEAFGRSFTPYREELERV